MEWPQLQPVLMNIFILQLFLSFCLIVVVFKYPVLIYRAYQRYLIFKTGFKLRRIKVSENYEFEYIEKGNMNEQEISLLLVHGYTSGKDAWCMMASYIPKRIHVVALDLPGHGGTTRKEKEDLTVPGIAKRVEQFVNAIGLNKKKYHIIGTSLGGFITGIHAATYPDNLLSVMLVCPAGIEQPVMSPMFLAYEKENKIKLLPETDEEFIEMINMLVYKPVEFPKFVVSGVMQARRQARSFYMKMLEGFMAAESKYLLQEKLPEIKPKMMIVWGKHDQALDVSATEVIKKILPNGRIEILDDCGHSISLERPRKLANIITSFLNESHSK